MKKKKRDDRPKMSASAIIVAGVMGAVLLFAALLAARHAYTLFSPTLSNGERLLERGRPKDAMALLDKMPDPRRAGGQATKRDVRALLLRGKVLFALLMDELREERWGSYGVNPDNWIAHPLADEAEKCFLDAMAIAPNDPEIRRLLGNLYREQGRFAESEAMLRAALDLDGADSEALLALGLLFAEGHRPEAAEKTLLYAWELDEGNPKIAKNIGYFYRFYKDVPESSIEWFTRYLAANPRRDPDIGLIRGELKTLMERYPEFEGYKTGSEPRKRFVSKKR